MQGTERSIDGRFRTDASLLPPPLRTLVLGYQKVEQSTDPEAEYPRNSPSLQVIAMRGATVTENDSGGEYYESGCFTDLERAMECRPLTPVSSFAHVVHVTSLKP